MGYMEKICPATRKKISAIVLPALTVDNNSGTMVMCQHRKCPFGRKYLCCFRLHPGILEAIGVEDEVKGDVK